MKSIARYTLSLVTKLKRRCKILLSALFLSIMPASVYALGDPSYVSEEQQAGAVALVSKDRVAKIYVDPNDFPGVVRTANDLQKDIERVTGKSPEIINDWGDLSEHAIVVGTIGHSALLDQLIADAKISIAGIEGKWDAFQIEAIANPLPNVKKMLVIAGANRRGTSYGIYDLSEQIGVSPWYYWADVPPNRKEAIYIPQGTKKEDYPAIKYRGIFLNNEAPALTNWVAENHGDYNHEFYVKIFELMLRLKANYLWPAMWNNSFNVDDPKNRVLAHEYGIVMGTSHHEPMMRSDKEWDHFGEGAWEYSTNPKNLYKFWEEGAKRNKPYESIFTLGMRGQEDSPMSEGENTELLERIVSDQREILRNTFQDQDISTIPQVWTLYKEVQGFYENGMRVPDDVTLLWTNDNWGNIRRLPTPQERERAGGAGMYYHFEYVGGPRSYRWLNTMPIAKMWEQMHLAYRYEANRIWITNSGNLKPMEVPTEFFLRMAWDPERWPKERIKEFGILWAEREFGKEHAEEVEALITGYTRHNGRRKPELMAPDTYSLLNYNEAERIAEELEELVSRAEALYKKIPEERQDAFFQLVLHPVKATAIVTQLNIATGKNRLYAAQGRSTTDAYRQKAKGYFKADNDLKEQYHNLNGGKWNHFMSQTHIGYTNWQSPEGDQLPVLHEYRPGDYAEIGIAVEGIASGWPAAVSGTWPHRANYGVDLDYLGKPYRTLTLYNRGTLPYEFTAKPSAPWIKLSESSGEITDEREVRVSVDWDAVPEGKTSGTITIRGTGWQPAIIHVNATKPDSKVLRKAKGFVEADGYIAIEAASFTENKAKNNIQWEEIDRHGRTKSSMAPYPVTDTSFEKPKRAPYLEYDVTFFTTGTFELHAILAPSLPFVPGRGLRYAIAVGNEKPQIIDFLEGYVDTDHQWEQSVKDGVRISTSTHQIKKQGPTTVRIYMVDSGVVLQRLIFDTGGLKPSYLGPEESPQANALSR